MSNANEKGFCNDCGGKLYWSETNQDFICHNTDCPTYGVFGYPSDDDEQFECLET